MDSAQPTPVFNPYPDPILTEQEVVKIQLDALQNNDLMRANAGIRIAYRFASPVSRDKSGTFEDFVHVFKHPLYAPLIGFESANLGSIRYNPGSTTAWLHVTLYHGGRTRAGFRWVLSRQQTGQNAGCWLVDAVIRTL